MTFKTYSSPHFCSFRRVSGSTNKTKTETSWLDKCRCGRVIQTDVAYGGDRPLIKKNWFAKDGTFERTTGDNPTNDKQA